mmetsp:Transcript_43059/g.77351  ORF Transcript_43059/g.77351 Transcript_43059/m.77351 type:complete len:834 (-) Transcript_43059:43-2544(-)
MAACDTEEDQRSESPEIEIEKGNKAVSFDLFKNDCFSNKKAPPRALLERLNHRVALPAKELREKREKLAEDESAQSSGQKQPSRPERPQTLRRPQASRDRGAKAGGGTADAESDNQPPESKADDGADDESLERSTSSVSDKKATASVEVIGVGVGIEDQPQIQLAPPPELTEEQRAKSMKMVAVYGEETVRGLHSQKWIHRMDAIKEIASTVQTYKSGKATVKGRMLEVFMQVVGTLLMDSVLQVYLQCMDFFRVVVGEFSEDIDPAVVKEHLRPLIKVLLMRTGDMNSRICNSASEFLLYLPTVPPVGSEFVAEYLTEPIENPNAFKHVIARLNLILNMITQYGFKREPDSSLAPERVMNVIVEALNGTNPRVKKQATLVVVEAYKRLGKDTEKYLRSCKPATLKYLKTEIEVELCDIDALTDAHVRTQEEDDLAVLEPFSEEENRKMQPLVEVFGPGIACLFSKQWKLRENALDRLKQQLELGSLAGLEPSLSPRNGRRNQQMKKSFMHTCRVEVIGLQDALPPVYNKSCELLRTAAEVYGQHVGENDFKLGMENIITLLINKAGDLNTVVKNNTMETLTCLASHEKIGVGFVATYMLTPIENLNQWRIVVARLELLDVFVREYGFQAGGLSTEATMTFAVSTFQSPNGKVRKAAVNLILEVYKKAGNIVRTYLRNQKPALVNELKSKIMKIARKDRTKSAPIQRLANIVQPLGTEDMEPPAGESRNPRRRPKTFPATIGDLETNETLSVRERVEHWKKEKEQLGQSVEYEYEGDGVVVTGKEKSSKERPVGSAAANRDIEPLAGPGVQMSTDAVQGRPKRATIRGRMVFQ